MIVVVLSSLKGKQKISRGVKKLRLVAKERKIEFWLSVAHGARQQEGCRENL